MELLQINAGERDWGLGIGSWGSGISLRLIMEGETLPGHHILSIPPVPSTHSPNRRSPIHPTTQRESQSPGRGKPAYNADSPNLRLWWGHSGRDW
jgi:hypothetical protein